MQRAFVREVSSEISIAARVRIGSTSSSKSCASTNGDGRTNPDVQLVHSPYAGVFLVCALDRSANKIVVKRCAVGVGAERGKKLFAEHYEIAGGG